MHHHKMVQLAVLVVLSNIIFVSYMMSSRCTPEMVVVKNLTCLGGVVTVQSSGRLGNKILEYLSAWSLANIYNMTFLVPEGMLRELNQGFEGLSARTIPAYLGDMRKKYFGLCDQNVTEKTILKDVLLNIYPITDTIRRLQLQGKPLVLRGAVILDDGIVRMGGKVTTELRFKKMYVDHSQTILREFRNSAANVSKVIFVGVHVRLTDYSNYLRRRFKAGELATPTYYRHAVSWMREQLFKDEKGPLHVIFVVVSDDIKWCIQNLLPEMLKDKHNKISDQLGTFDVFPASNGKIQSAFHDLALLASCNHSIIAYGTYGMTAALLAGGRTVVYDLEFGDKNKNVTERIATLRFVDRMDHWKALH